MEGRGIKAHFINQYVYRGPGVFGNKGPCAVMVAEKATKLVGGLRSQVF